MDKKLVMTSLQVGPFGTNCYIVGDGVVGEGMIIDPGDSASKILDAASRMGLDIKQVVLTHGHIDHTGALKKVKQATGATVAISEADAPIMGKQPMGIVLGLFYPSPDSPDRLLKDGEEIVCGGLKFNVIHTPGHTPGGICLWGEGILFSGDTLFHRSVGRSDLPGGSHEELIESITGRLISLPDDTQVYPGHGPSTSIGEERALNPFL